MRHGAVTAEIAVPGIVFRVEAKLRHARIQQIKPRVYAIGASYDFEVVKVATSFARTTDGWIQGQGATGLIGLPTARFADNFKANSYMLGVTVPVGSGAIVSSWQHISPKNDNLMGVRAKVDRRTNTITGFKSNDAKTNVLTVGYTYDFSKRTNLYAFVSHVKNVAFIEDAKSTATGVGLRHRF